MPRTWPLLLARGRAQNRFPLLLAALVAAPTKTAPSEIWARSAGHRANMLLRNVSAYGIASATGRTAGPTGRWNWAIERLPSRRGMAKGVLPSAMLKRENFPVAKIYVPTERRKTRDQKRVDEVAESMLQDGQQTPIKVRADGDRFVLIEGLHRLEAAKALGETTIVGFRVDARKH